MCWIIIQYTCKLLCNYPTQNGAPETCMSQACFSRISYLFMHGFSLVLSCIMCMNYAYFITQYWNMQGIGTFYRYWTGMVQVWNIHAFSLSLHVCTMHKFHVWYRHIPCIALTGTMHGTGTFHVCTMHSICIFPASNMHTISCSIDVMLWYYTSI